MNMNSTNPLLKYQEVPPFVEFGYKPKTTFWGDFGVADVFYLNGMEKTGVQDTYNRAFKQYKDDREYGTELAMVLNHKMWEHHNRGNEELEHLYSKLFDELDSYVIENWRGDDLHYYLTTTD